MFSVQEGLNFDAFLPLFGDNALNVRVAVISDGDPPDCYPKLGDEPELSDAAKAIKMLANGYVRPFFALKTFEYDLSLYPENRAVMLAALEDIHPGIGKDLKPIVDNAADSDKPRALFSGMFERGSTKKNIQKGAFGQALAQVISTDGTAFTVPPYIKEALEFIATD